MERAPLKPPAGSTEKSPAQKNAFQDIMIFLYGESITEEVYKKGMEQQQAGDDPGDYEYIDTITHGKQAERKKEGREKEGKRRVILYKINY